MNRLYVRNGTGDLLSPKDVVCYLAVEYGYFTVKKAKADNIATLPAIGFVETPISGYSFGYIVLDGVLGGLDWSAYMGGTPLYVSPNSAGGLTNIPPADPNYIQQVGVVLDTSRIQIKIDSVQNPVSASPVAVHDSSKHSDSYLPNTAFNGLSKISVGTVEPVAPSAGDLWIDTN